MSCAYEHIWLAIMWTIISRSAFEIVASLIVGGNNSVSLFFFKHAAVHDGTRVEEAMFVALICFSTTFSNSSSLVQRTCMSDRAKQTVMIFCCSHDGQLGYYKCCRAEQSLNVSVHQLNPTIYIQHYIQHLHHNTFTTTHSPHTDICSLKAIL